jgi:DNA-binding SARP family transcriptional activator
MRDVLNHGGAAMHRNWPKRTSHISEEEMRHFCEVLIQRFEQDEELAEKLLALLNIDPIREQLMSQITSLYRRYFGEAPLLDGGDW